MRDIEFYFDFSSPYAYLAHSRLPEIADKYGCRLVYKPIDMFAARLAAGNTGPTTPQMPRKFRYISKDLMRWAQRYGVPFVMGMAPKPGAPEAPKPTELPKAVINSSRAHKGMFFALKRGQERDYAKRLWAATFGSGGLVGSDEVLRNVARQMGWPEEEFLTFVQSGEVERIYEEANKEAQGRGVFGVPTMFVGDEMWWGNDRLFFLEEYLAAHPAS